MGPITSEGRAISARHGMCAKTLILFHESEGDWLQLLETWLNGYQNPVENSLLYTFVLRTAQAEWHRLRIQREYDFSPRQSAHRRLAASRNQEPRPRCPLPYRR